VSVAATPAWFADNVVTIAVVTFLVLTGLVLRLVTGILLRSTLLALIAAVALFTYVNRQPLQACARTCECEIADRHLTVPACDADLDL